MGFVDARGPLILTGAFAVFDVFGRALSFLEIVITLLWLARRTTSRLACTSSARSRRRSLPTRCWATLDDMRVASSEGSVAWPVLARLQSGSRRF